MKAKIAATIAVLGLALAVFAGTTNFPTYLVIQDSAGSPPSCSTATSDGELCVEGDVEVISNLEVDGTTSLAGDITLTGGPGALRLPDGDETVMVEDNDSTALVVESDDGTNLMTLDTSNSDEGIIIEGYLDMSASEVVTDTSFLRFCGQGPNGTTSVFGAPVTLWAPIGGTDCDAAESTTEGTADEVVHLVAWNPTKMTCAIVDGGTDDTLTFQLRSAEGDVSGMTCNVTLDGSGVEECTVSDTTPETIAANATVAVEAVASTDDDCTGCDFECIVWGHY